MREIKKSINKQLVLGFVLILICFLIAVKALSSITTVIFEDINIVCLDPGHGGEDVGATYNSKTRLEKNDNLDLALKVKAELEKMDVKVIMTRETDTFVSLKDRCKTANRGRADLFVSLHRNSSSDGTGIEVWIKDQPSEQEEKLAKDILTALVNSSEIPERGVKKGYRDSTGNNYYVNANTNMTSCLVEVGFISNEVDNADFDKNIDAYAKSIAKAIYDNLQ
ncbi:MAG: N-acetylmuramoyl-L-alanine amidase [Clostridia bacterium]|nr:N-acetylmuramoyl-L-alanine amidase [Clostridia bacterium]